MKLMILLDSRIASFIM